jgi:hypothetical protein
MVTLMPILATSDNGNYFGNVAQACSTGEAPQGGGILSTIIYAILKGLLQGVRSQLAPKRRRRRSYTSYFGTRHKRRAKTPTLEDIFGQILTGK